MNTFDWFVVAGTCAIVLAVGLWHARAASRRRTEGYFAGGRDLPWWAIGLSNTATYSSGNGAFVMLVLVFGLAGNWLWWASWIVWMPLVAFIWARLWRRLRIITTAELFSLRYAGAPVLVARKPYAAACAFGFAVLIISYITGFFVKTLAPLCPLAARQVLAIFGGITVLYSMFGGLLGVVYADVVQFAIMSLGGAAFFVFAVMQHDGWDQILLRGDAASRTQDFSGFYPAPDQITWESYGETTRADNRNRGVVVHPLKWVSVFYNKSTTFAPMGRENYDPYGNPYPGSGGDTREYGVRFDFWNNRVNRFESSAGPTTAPNGPLRYYNRDSRVVELRIVELDPSLPRINVGGGANRGFPTGSGYMVMSSRVAGGYDVSLDFRPIPQWNIRLNGGQTEAIDSDIGVEWRQWIAERLPVWPSVVAKNGEVDASGRPVTWATALVDPGSALAPNKFRPKDAPEYAILHGGELRTYKDIPEGSIPDDLARQIKHGYYAAVSLYGRTGGQTVRRTRSPGFAEEHHHHPVR